MNKEFSCFCISYHNIIEPSQRSIEESLRKNNYITIAGFESKDSANKFIEMFPKYLKLKIVVGNSLSSVYEEFGIKEERTKLGIYITYDVIFKIQELNKVTGEFNELGEKRINGFIRTLKKYEYID